MKVLIRKLIEGKYLSNWQYISLVGLVLAGMLAVTWTFTGGANASTIFPATRSNEVKPAGKLPDSALDRLPSLPSGQALSGRSVLSVQSGKGGAEGDRGSGAPAPAAVASPTCSPDWTTITTPNAVFSGSFLTSVAEVGPNDVWAGGTYQGDSSSTQYNPFFEHWDGTSWTLIAAPLPASGAGGMIWGMSVSSANDIWAVGLYEIGTNAYELIYRWNGLQWDVVAGPHPSATDNELFGVTVVSTNNVWAVGTYTMAGLKKTLIEHWDGASWSHVGSPNEGTGDNSLQSISVVPGSSGNDMWAAGNYYPTPGSAEQTLTLHYNGVLWSYVNSANQGTGDNQLKSITAISAGDVWAVGSYRSSNIQHTLAEHWNGSVWSISPTVNPGSQGNTFVGVFATAGNDVWAVGETTNGITTLDTLVEHWNGSTWSVEPNTAPGAASLAFGIGGGSGSDVWVVGYYAPSLTASTGQVMTEHYNGTTWAQVYAPDPPTSADLLLSVSAVSAGDIWAVGSAQGYISGDFTSQAVIEHWDGTTWSIVASAHPTTFGDRLVSVKARSATDVWAVGYYSNATNEQTLIEHWNGTAWSQITSPNPGGSSRDNTLTGVDAASANDLWAVGYYHNGTMFQTLILHWDGTLWLQFTSPNPGALANFLYDVTVVPGSGGTDAWAVGYYRNSSVDKYAPLLERWNGSAWSVVSAPNVAGVDNELVSIFALSANDVWAVGYTVDSSSPTQNLALHWNGSAWTISSIAQQGPYGNELNDVTGTASNDVYAIGYYTEASTHDHGLIEHWNGLAWSVVPSLQTPGFNSLLLGITAVSSTDIWAVGTYLQAGFGDEQTLAMLYNPCTVSCSISFSDVPVGSTFYPYIHCLACLGIINGYPDGTFKPGANVTRGQLSKIVANSAGFSDPQPNQMFQDVPVGSTFQVFIGRLASRGYISGYACGGTGEPCQPGNLPYFRPGANATRGQISKIDSNAAGYHDNPSGQQFEDVAVGSTYYTYTYRLVSRTIMAGYACGHAPAGPCVAPGNLPYFVPNNNATRGQTSKIVSGTFFPDCSALDAVKP